MNAPRTISLTNLLELWTEPKNRGRIFCGSLDVTYCWIRRKPRAQIHTDFLRRQKQSLYCTFSVRCTTSHGGICLREMYSQNTLYLDFGEIWKNVSRCISLYRAVSRCIALHRAALCCIALHCAASRCIVLYCAVLRCIALYRISSVINFVYFDVFCIILEHFASFRIILHHLFILQ